MKDPGVSVGTNFDAKSFPAANLRFLICRVDIEPGIAVVRPHTHPRLLRSSEPQFLPLRRGSDSSQVASLALGDQEGRGRVKAGGLQQGGRSLHGRGGEGAAWAREILPPGVLSAAPPRGTRRQLWDGVCAGAVARPGAGARAGARRGKKL